MSSIWIYCINNRVFDPEKPFNKDGYINLFFNDNDTDIKEGDVLLILKSSKSRFIKYSFIVENIFTRKGFYENAKSFESSSLFWEDKEDFSRSENGSVVMTKFFKIFKNKIPKKKFEVPKQNHHYYKIDEKYYKEILAEEYFSKKELSLYNHLLVNWIK